MGERRYVQRQLAKWVFAFPIVFIVAWIFPIINRLYELARGESSYALYMLQAVLMSSQGFFNLLAYGLRPGVVDFLRCRNITRRTRLLSTGDPVVFYDSINN